MRKLDYLQKNGNWIELISEQQQWKPEKSRILWMYGENNCQPSITQQNI